MSIFDDVKERNLSKFITGDFDKYSKININVETRENVVIMNMMIISL